MTTSWLLGKEESRAILVTILGGRTLCSIETNGGLSQAGAEVWRVHSRRHAVLTIHYSFELQT